MKVMSIFGTRPEAIKMAPLVRAIEASADLSGLVCVTGQHRAMLDQVLRFFGIVPDIDLDVMVPNQTLNGLMSRVLARLDEALATHRPDYVLVHGDTTTALAATLAAFHRGIPVGHVEAGLRTYDLTQPWPEEMNRQVVDRMARDLFSPTEQSAAHLRDERAPGRIFVTGNTVIDALLMTLGRIDADAELKATLDRQFSFLDPGRRLVLVTGHRRENFGEGFAQICEALAALAQRQDIEIVYPVHLNPNVRGPVHERLSGKPNLHLIAPLDYVPFVALMRRANVILTDSGGVQEEAPSLGKPVLVMRDVTERPEAVAAGTVELVGTDAARIVAHVTRILDRADSPSASAARINPYGDGGASRRIVDVLCGRIPLPFHDRAAQRPARMRR
ncbi:UDP-N-acetylglucosamine 2-epimerase [Azorhizobium sp. AG788]|nr:UDP-N-acetylglucosamine 2-epimerase (non-hydrolyzing) [Azorhizobium sp. AG788]TDT93670.1 UDP-N-acetylglucosamine 2-epimerase [Azorhizobium sp. AG788]